MSFKAFELVPVVEQLSSERAKVECIEAYEENLYVGTSDCCVIFYVIRQGVSPTGKITFQCQFKKTRQLEHKKPIEKIIVCSTLSRLLVLCSGTVTVLNSVSLDKISISTKLKAISDMCPNESLDEHAHLTCEVCFASSKRKSVSIYTLTEDRLILSKDLSVPEPIAKLRRDGQAIFMASQSLYYLLDVASGQCNSFIRLDCEVEAAFIQRVGAGEFLLRASDLGVFIDKHGEAKRTPLRLVGQPFQVAYHFPYVLALCYDQVHVYSVLTEEHKQTISFQGGCALASFGKRVLIASHRQIYSLAMIDLEQQVQHLFAEAHVTEALFLAQVSLVEDDSLTPSNNQRRVKQLQRYQQQAGFAFLSQFLFEEAAEQFHDSSMDFRELVILFPGLLSKSSSFRSRATDQGLHKFSDATALTKGNPDKLKKLQQFVVSYLEDVRLTAAAHGKRDDLDTALLKLYAMGNCEQLLGFIGGENAANVEASVEALREFKRFHALGLLYCFHNMAEKALEVWVQLNDGELVDPAHPGMSYVVEFLASLSDHQLVSKFASWALQKDQPLAATIFTHRPHNETSSEFTRPDSVLDYLNKYTIALRIYLEHLVFTKKLEKEKYHTHLAVLYLDEVLEIQESQQTRDDTTELVESQKLKDARHRLCRMLETSSLYRVTLLLGKIQDTNLYNECAILYGKLEQHEKALQLLVHRLKDYSAAQRYCTVNSSDRDLRYRRKLFLALLTVYLTPVAGQGQLLVVQAMDLLNCSEAEFDVSQVLQILPETWSISLISNFLSRSIRRSMSQARASRLQHSLARGEALQVKHTFIRAHARPVVITEDR